MSQRIKFKSIEEINLAALKVQARVSGVGLLVGGLANSGAALTSLEVHRQAKELSSFDADHDGRLSLDGKPSEMDNAREFLKKTYAGTLLWDAIEQLSVESATLKDPSTGSVESEE